MPSREHFPDPYDNSERAARALFDRTCGFMGVDRARLELEFYQPTHRPGLARSLVRSKLEWAGQFQLRDGTNLVRVDVTLLPLPESLIAVYAHELAHQLLLGSQRICADDRDHELVTDMTTAFFGMAVLIELGLLPQALRDAEAAVRFEHDDSESYLVRGAAYVKVGRFESAIVDLTRYIKEVDEPVASGRHASRGFYLRGFAHAGLRNFSKAIKDYGRAINRWPDWPEPYEARAEIHELLGNTKRADADREQARRRAAP